MELRSDIRDDIADLVVGEVDKGASNGSLVLLTSGNSAAVTFELASPAFLPATDGVCVADLGAGVEDNNAAGGTVTQFEIRDGDGSWVIRGTVGPSDADFILADPNIDPGDRVELTFLSYEAPDAP